MELEKRYFKLDRRAKDDAGRVLSGTALRYGDLAQLPWGKERVQPGAFSPISDVVLNASHDRADPWPAPGEAGLRSKTTPNAWRSVRTYRTPERPTTS